MKHIRTRIAAAVVAAAAAACTMQAVTASAYVSNHANWLTGQTQESTEYGANFAHSLYYLQRSLNNEGTCSLLPSFIYCFKSHTLFFKKP